MNYQLTDTKALTAIEPAGPLPDWLAALNVPEDQIRDLTWTGRTDQGFWPVLVTEPAFDRATETLTEVFGPYTVDGTAKVWRAVLAKRALTPAELAARVEVATAAVDGERDRRIAAGFVYQGATFQSRPDDFTNLGGASTAAVAAVLNGAQPGDLRWANPSKDFAWIAADNSLVRLDAPGMIALGTAAMDHRSRMIFAGAALKIRIRAGEAVADVTADALWT